MNCTVPLVFCATILPCATVTASIIVIAKSGSSVWILPNFVASIPAAASEIPPVYIIVPVVNPANVLPSSIVRVPDACVIAISVSSVFIVVTFPNESAFKLSDVSDKPPENTTVPDVLPATITPFATFVTSVISIEKSASSDWIFPKLVSLILSFVSDIPPVKVTVPVVLSAKVAPFVIPIVPDAWVILILFVFPTIVVIFANVLAIKFVDVSDTPSVIVILPVPITPTIAAPCAAVTVPSPFPIVMFILSAPELSVIVVKSADIPVFNVRFAAVSVIPCENVIPAAVFPANDAPCAAVTVSVTVIVIKSVAAVAIPSVSSNNVAIAVVANVTVTTPVVFATISFIFPILATDDAIIPLIVIVAAPNVIFVAPVTAAAVTSSNVPVVFNVFVVVTAPVVFPPIPDNVVATTVDAASSLISIATSASFPIILSKFV